MHRDADEAHQALQQRHRAHGRSRARTAVAGAWARSATWASTSRGLTAGAPRAIERVARRAAPRGRRGRPTAASPAPRPGRARSLTWRVSERLAARTTRSPTFLCRTMPTAGSMRLSTVSRPAPSSIAGVADGAAADRGHAAVRAACSVDGLAAPAAAGPGRRRRAGSPPCSSMTSWNFRRPAPEASAVAHPARGAASRLARRAGQVRASRPQLQRERLQVPRAAALQGLDRTRRPRGRCRRVRPSGWSMSVMRAATFLPMPRPIVDHGLGQRPRVLERLHERAVAGLHVEHEGVDALRHLLAHDRGGDERPALHGGGHVAQRVELAVGGRDLRRLADEAPGRSSRSTARNSCEREAAPGSPGSTPACRACRRCGRGRGRRSSARRRRRPRPAGARTRLVLSPTPPVECLSTLGPGQVGEVEHLARAHHRLGEGHRLLRRSCPGRRPPWPGRRPGSRGSRPRV